MKRRERRAGARYVVLHRPPDGGPRITIGPFNHLVDARYWIERFGNELSQVLVLTAPNWKDKS